MFISEPFPPPPPPPPDTKGKERHLKAAVIGLSIGLATVITIVLFVILCNRRIKPLDVGVQNQSRTTYQGLGLSRNITNPESGAVYFGIPVFSFEELRQATNNFDQARQLGEGGFGTVYYGEGLLFYVQLVLVL